MTMAGAIFLLGSAVLVYNLWPKKEAPVVNHKTTAPIVQTQKEVLGAQTHQEPAVTETPAQTAEFTEYTVQNGDTLFNISQKYNLRWDSIAQINNLSEPYVLHAGQTLKIPQATTSKVPGKIYTIKTGDTLASIARQFNITVDDIIAVNPNLQKSDLITVGQVIKLP